MPTMASLMVCCGCACQRSSTTATTPCVRPSLRRAGRLPRINGSSSAPGGSRHLPPPAPINRHLTSLSQERSQDQPDGAEPVDQPVTEPGDAPGRLTVIAVDAAEQPLPGACFAVVELGFEVCDDDGDGAVVFDAVPSAPLTLRETAPPPGFASVGDLPISIEPTGARCSCRISRLPIRPRSNRPTSRRWFNRWRPHRTRPARVKSCSRCEIARESRVRGLLGADRARRQSVDRALRR